MDSKFPAAAGFTCDKAGLTDAVLRTEISATLCMCSLIWHYLLHIFSQLASQQYYWSLCWAYVGYFECWHFKRNCIVVYVWHLSVLPDLEFHQFFLLYWGSELWHLALVWWMVTTVWGGYTASVLRVGGSEVRKWQVTQNLPNLLAQEQSYCRWRKDI